jgi:hypothetical protein
MAVGLGCVRLECITVYRDRAKYRSVIDDIQISIAAKVIPFDAIRF